LLDLGSGKALGFGKACLELARLDDLISLC